MQLTKNADLNKCRYSGYGIGINSRSQSSWTDGSWGKNVIIFGADVSSSLHVDNKKESILVLGEGPMQSLGNTTITAEDKYSINFTDLGKKFVLSLHYNSLKQV